MAPSSTHQISGTAMPMTLKASHIPAPKIVVAISTLAVAKSRIMPRRRFNSAMSTCRLPANNSSASTALRNTRGKCVESIAARSPVMACRWNSRSLDAMTSDSTSEPSSMPIAGGSLTHR